MLSTEEESELSEFDSGLPSEAGEGTPFAPWLPLRGKFISGEGGAEDSALLGGRISVRQTIGPELMYAIDHSYCSAPFLQAQGSKRSCVAAPSVYATKG